MSEQASHSGEPALFQVLQARLVDEVCNRFEADWRAGRQPRIEDFLDPTLRSVHGALLPELLALELTYRRDRGERPSAAEYRQRFPKHGQVIRAVWQNLAEPGRTTAPATVVSGQAKTMSAKPSPTMHTPADPDLEAQPATGADEAAPPSFLEVELPPAAAAWPEIPGYQILGKLGEGGMGVVYKARQVELNRLVALKMILPARAGEHGVARFRIEAEAVAQMQHPNVVQIFEIGEYEGQPFFSLEYVEGGSLADRLDGTPWPGAAATRLMETLARAMDAAHRRQIIHRDLKPANVLLAADGTPKITDFGLAKRLDGGPGRTQSGVIMGTPSYMPPEQAQGKNDAVGPAADVYALGAILYELLTGRPPFKAATPLDTVLQVINEEPVPPYQLQPKTPRDLETICLKCLEKSPSRRYASAEAVAEDLCRFREGRPITARPVGRGERAARWVRRNPVVSGLLAAVVVVVIFGLVFSTYFAVDAAQKAEQAQWNEGEAKRNAKEANDKKGEAEAARTDLERTNQNLRQSQNDLEHMSARSLLRPLGLQPYPVLTDPEIDVLWELTENRGERVWKLFVADALQRPDTIEQLYRRAECALHAAVGLEPAKRAQVEQLLMEKLRSQDLPETQRLQLGVAAAKLGGLSAEARRDSTRALVQPLFQAEFINGIASKEIVASLAAVAAHLDPEEAARNADTLLATFSKLPIVYHVIPEGEEALVVLADRLGPDEAATRCAAAAHTLVKVMTNPVPHVGPSHPLGRLGEGLAVVATRLKPDEAAARCAAAAHILTQAIAKSNQPLDLAPSGVGLAAIAGRLKPDEAAARCVGAADAIVQAMTKATVRDYELRDLVKALVALAVYLKPEDAAARCVAAANVLIQRKPRTNTIELDEPLAALIACLGSNEAAGTAETFITLDSARLGGVSGTLLNQIEVTRRAVAAHLEPKKAARVADALIQALANATDVNPLSGVGEALRLVAARLEPNEAARITNALILTMDKPTANRSALYYLDAALPVLAARLEPNEAARTAHALTQALVKNSPAGTKETVEAIAVLAVYLEPNEAPRVVHALTQIMLRNTHLGYLQELGAALVTVADRCGPEKAAVHCTAAADALTQVMVRLQNVAQNSATANPNFDFQFADLGRAVAVLAARLGPEEAASRCTVAADILTQALRKSKIPFYLSRLGMALAAVANYLKPDQVAACCAVATDALAEVMARSAVRHNPGMADTVHPEDLAPLGVALAAVAAYLKPDEAAARCAAAAHDLTQAMTKTIHQPDALQQLTASLAAVAARLKPAEAAAARRAAADILIQSMARNPYAWGPYAFPQFRAALASMTDRLEPEEAAFCWAIFAELLTKTLTKTHKNGPYQKGELGQVLTAVLVRVDPPELSRRSAALAATLGQVGNGAHFAAILPQLRTVVEPFSPRFSIQQLVDLLKSPTCVGQARRIILDHLGTRYGRTFADQWEFVHFAQEKGLGLDFTSPPVRFKL